MHQIAQFLSFSLGKIGSSMFARKVKIAHPTHYCVCPKIISMLAMCLKVYLDPFNSNFSICVSNFDCMFNPLISSSDIAFFLWYTTSTSKKSCHFVPHFLGTQGVHSKKLSN